MKQEKHNHKFTNCLKGILFSIVMLLPFLAIGATTGYVMFNKNAKDSYEGSYIFNTWVQMEQEETTPNTELNIITPVTQFENNETTKEFSITINVANWRNPGIYFIPSKGVTINGQSYNEEYQGIYFKFNGAVTSRQREYGLYNNIDYTKPFNEQPNKQLNKKYDLGTEGNFTVTARYTSTTQYNYVVKYTDNSYTEYPKTLEFIKNLTNNTKELLTTKDTTLSNVFYAQTDKIWQAPLFNWVMNGPFYAGITAFTGLFGIPNQTFFSNLLIYWLTMICIYIIIDIILELFIYLSHFLFEKRANT